MSRLGNEPRPPRWEASTLENSHSSSLSGSTGSTCFWASRIQIRVHLSEVWIRIRILLSSSRNSKKNLDFYCFVTSFWLFIFGKWCKCSSFLLESCRSTTKISGSGIRIHYGSADPDPYRIVMDPEHWLFGTSTNERATSGGSRLYIYFLFIIYCNCAAWTRSWRGRRWTSAWSRRWTAPSAPPSPRSRLLMSSETSSPRARYRTLPLPTLYQCCGSGSTSFW